MSITKKYEGSFLDYFSSNIMWHNTRPLDDPGNYNTIRDRYKDSKSVSPGKYFRIIEKPQRGASSIYIVCCSSECNKNYYTTRRKLIRKILIEILEMEEDVESHYFFKENPEHIELRPGKLIGDLLFAIGGIPVDNSVYYSKTNTYNYFLRGTLLFYQIWVNTLDQEQFICQLIGQAKTVSNPNFLDKVIRLLRCYSYLKRRYCVSYKWLMGVLYILGSEYDTLDQDFMDMFDFLDQTNAKLEIKFELLDCVEEYCSGCIPNLPILKKKVKKELTIKNLQEDN